MANVQKNINLYENLTGSEADWELDQNVTYAHDTRKFLGCVECLHGFQIFDNLTVEPLYI